MSGHSKWATTKHKKAAIDAKRSALFSKLSRNITVAAKLGGDPLPENNASLAAAVARARMVSMPNAKIKAAIDKAFGAGADAAVYSEITYEGYGPSGVAVIVEAATDNRNRTAGDVRHYFDKFGGNLGQVGCVGFLFSTKGVIAISALDEWGDRVVDGDKLMEEALEAGAADFVEEDNVYEIYCEPDDLSAVADDLSKKGYTFLSSEIEKVPSTYVTLTSEDDIKHMNLLLENLEENEDIVNVWHNWDEA